ncbi:T9SS type A sorting domain-containing protein, partial [Arthrospira platensis SPKY1]|nr:T9SS type A sorting domain-containing protein [Arthrospira platensis SPKY1]
NQLVAIHEVRETQAALFQIVPQPAKGSTTIISNILFTAVKIYDLQGSMLAHQQSFPTKTIDLDISKLQPGIYQVVIFDENKTARYSKMVVL